MLTKIQRARLARDLTAAVLDLEDITSRGPGGGVAQAMMAARLATGVTALFDPSSQSIIDSTEPGCIALDAVGNPIQRVKLASQLAAKVAELAAAPVPGAAGGPMAMMQRARLTKEVNELLSRLVEVDSLAQDDRPIELTGLELGSFPETPDGVKALRAVAIDALESMLGDWVSCPALGRDVELRRSGLKKVKSTSADPRKLKIIPVLKKLIGSAKNVGSKPNYDKANSPNIVEYQTLRSLVTLVGQELAVRFVVARDDKGAYHYDHTVFLREVIFDDANENGPIEMSPLVLPGGNRGCTQSRSAVPEPTRLLSVEPSTKQQDGRILDDSRSNVKSMEVVNLFFEEEEAEFSSKNPDEQMLSEIAEGSKDDRPLDVLWSLIYQAVESLMESGALSGQTETLANDAITHWAELEEQANV